MHCCFCCSVLFLLLCVRNCKRRLACYLLIIPFNLPRSLWPLLRRCATINQPVVGDSAVLYLTKHILNCNSYFISHLVSLFVDHVVFIFYASTRPWTVEDTIAPGCTLLALQITPQLAAFSTKSVFFPYITNYRL